MGIHYELCVSIKCTLYIAQYQNLHSYKERISEKVMIDQKTLRPHFFYSLGYGHHETFLRYGGRNKKYLKYSFYFEFHNFILIEGFFLLLLQAGNPKNEISWALAMPHQEEKPVLDGLNIYRPKHTFDHRF